MKTGEIRGTIFFIWAVLGLLTGGIMMDGASAADRIISSVTSDGLVMSSSSARSGDDTTAGRIFGYGQTSIDRETQTQGAPSSHLLARSAGTLLIGEYTGSGSSSDEKNPEGSIGCVFMNQTERQPSPGNEIRAAGIIRQGWYAQDTAAGLGSSLVRATGSGMMGISHQIAGNGTITGRTLAAGNFSLSELIEQDPAPSSLSFF
jgi:hypothetical protein